MDATERGIENPAFDTDINHDVERPQNIIESPLAAKRDKWGNDIEFLMSCIALSVGFGNVWRFPFIALDNGGGAFLIPYLVVFFSVGKPIYYLEMTMGQFSSRGTVRVFDMVPIMRGIGYGQVMATFFIASYYAALMALTLHYLVDSFYATLPWTYCRPEWGNMCKDSQLNEEEIEWNSKSDGNDIKKSSAEFYFVNIVLREKSNIDDGIGAPSWILALMLAFAWLLIALIIVKGVKSSGKVSYFLATFPYIIMLVLLVRSLTLPGSLDGVLYFLKPQWDKLLDAQVWYAAVTQVFFSLTVCYGIIVMYASYNRFRQNILRDCHIVTSLDTFTSMLAGIIIFGILGNLAYESKTSDIKSVVKGGPGLAFISYPDAIAKFKAVPQLFSALFFLMMLTLGVGTNIGVISNTINVICDRFTKIKRWIVVVTVVIICYCLGLMYITPGGQFILNFIDFYAVTLVAVFLGIFELITTAWLYGVKNICRDIKFMLNIETSLYYRLCWSIITPCFMTAILVYMLAEYKPLEYNNTQYPEELYVLGWCITAIGVGQLFIWGFYLLYQTTSCGPIERFKLCFKSTTDWGPLDPALLKEYQQFVKDTDTSHLQLGLWGKFKDNIFG